MSNKKTKTQENTGNEPVGYVHIDVFLDSAKEVFNLHTYQVNGFKAYMAGQYYKKKDQDFIPYLEKYLGKKLKV